MIKILLNGQVYKKDQPISVAGLLAELKLLPGRVAIEYNREVLSRDDYATTLLKDGDKIEIVHFVGGG